MSLNRSTCLAVGAALTLAAWTVPASALPLGPFAGHMLRHVLVVAVAAPLLALGLPVLRWRGVAVIAVLVEFLVVWGWHLPAAHGAARLSPLWYAAEQASFLAAGLLVWTSLLDPRHPLAGAAGLLLTSMHMTLLGALLVLADRALYHPLADLAAGLADQRIGGMIMLAVATPIYLGAGLAMVSRALGLRAGPGTGGLTE